MKTHQYYTAITWTGNQGTGTSNYQGYSRNHEITLAGKLHPILASSDPAFRGSPERYNPEELFLSSLSSCHMLWYLHLCATNGIIVTAYEDEAFGEMLEETDGRGYFTLVILRPHVTITDPNKKELAHALHAKSHQYCFIANSCNFPIRCEAVINSK